MCENAVDNRTLRDFLQETVPDYIGSVPTHWLESHILCPEIQILMGFIFLIVCIPGNLGQILVFIAYWRYKFENNFTSDSIVVLFLPIKVYVIFRSDRKI